MLRHELVTTSARNRPHVRRRWLSLRAHCAPTEPTQWMHPTPGTDCGIVHLLITHTHSVMRPFQQRSASFCPRATTHCLPCVPMSGGSSTGWWDGWEWRGDWADSSPPDPTPTEQAPDEQVVNAVHKLQDRLQQIQTLTRRRAHKAGTEATTSVSKGNDAYAAMEAVIKAREWQAEAKHAYDQQFAEAAEAERSHQRHAREDRSARETRQDRDNECRLFGSSPKRTSSKHSFERQEETIREINTLYGQLCQPRPTQW